MTDLHRLPDWPERLAAYLAQQRPRQFAWGVNDCAGFAAGAVLAITGRQVLPVQWASMADAARQLRALGGLQAAVDKVLPRLPSPALAQRGDVVLVSVPVRDGRPRRQWLAVVDGLVYWGPGAIGLQSGPMQAAVCAWGVGRAASSCR